MRNIIFYLAIYVAVITSCKKSQSYPYEDIPSKPNIIILYTDDLGYGDVGIHGAKGVKTPYIDSLAQNGLVFTDAHSSSATCTPSRYSLLTGSYAFRKNAAILPGTAPLIIDSDKETLPSMLQGSIQNRCDRQVALGIGPGEMAGRSVAHTDKPSRRHARQSAGKQHLI